MYLAGEEYNNYGFHYLRKIPTTKFFPKFQQKFIDTGCYDHI